MNYFESFINGLISGLGMVIIMTIFGFLTFKIARNWITKTITDIWTKVREEGIHLDDIQIDGSIKTKRFKTYKKKNKKKHREVRKLQ